MGGIIAENIFARVTKVDAPYCYPGLILQLCEEAGVDLNAFATTDERELITMDPPIPVPGSDVTYDPSLFKPLQTFEEDWGEHPRDTTNSRGTQNFDKPTRVRKIRDAASANVQAPQPKRARVQVPVPQSAPTQETVPETVLEESEDTTVNRNEEQGETPPETQATSPRREPPQAQPAEPQQAVPPPQAITMDILRTVLAEERAERRREKEERRKEKEVEKKKERELQEQARLRQEQREDERDMMMRQAFQAIGMLAQMVAPRTAAGVLPPAITEIPQPLPSRTGEGTSQQTRSDNTAGTSTGTATQAATTSKEPTPQDKPDSPARG